MSKLKRWKPKNGDTLYGFYVGFESKRNRIFEEVQINRVGRQYLYAGSWTKLRIKYKGFYPQYDELVAIDEDQNHRYFYYRTEEGAKKAQKAHELRFKLRNHLFSSETDDMIIHISRTLGLYEEE